MPGAATPGAEAREDADGAQHAEDEIRRGEEGRDGTELAKQPLEVKAKVLEALVGEPREIACRGDGIACRVARERVAVAATRRVLPGARLLEGIEGDGDVLPKQ